MCAKSVPTIARNFAEFRTNHPVMTADQIALLSYFEKCVRAMTRSVPFLQPWKSFGAVYFGYTGSVMFPKFSVRCDHHKMTLEIRGQDVLVINPEHCEKLTPEETARKLFLRLGE